MNIALHWIQWIVETVVFSYAVFIISSYWLLTIFSSIALRQYLQKNQNADFLPILSSPITPSVSILAPAYNEENTIVENVRSLLSLHYVDMELIVINDGSKDNTLEKLMKEYDLESIPFLVNYQIDCKPIKALYKSKNPAFSKLTVVDKINGGKADALNAGINVSDKKLFTTIDVDCIIEYDGLLKMVKPFLEQTEKRVIAVGGVVRIANSCQIEDGRIKEVEVPENLIPRIQVIEYLRAFILGRMAWSKMNGLLLISGAFGMFDREIALKAGGYNHHTVGEDMELVVRMRRYMHENKMGKYKVDFIPDPLCWTEVPGNIKILSRQRNRWTRGTIDTLQMHKRMFFNYKYGILGLFSFPYWVFCEWFAPFFEILGLIYLIVLLIFTNVNMLYLIILFVFGYCQAIVFSMYAIFADEISYHRYNKKSDIIKLIFTGLLEPIIYHPMTVWWALRGNYDYFIKNKKDWGAMPRAGFKKKSV
jgi:cellulose synthase/poly-beta-1,6-N-acetylglucosamine synthase-like glycosyltransferase